MHGYARTLRARALLAPLAALILLAGWPPADASAGAPEWLPLRESAQVGCTRRTCDGGTYHGNWALDFGAPAGRPVYAAGSGTVTAVGAYGSCLGDSYSAIRSPHARGNWVEINHGGGVTSRYLHLRSIGVSRGQQVDPSTQIGAVGNTGASTCNWPHLHYERRVGGAAADPGGLRACHDSTLVTYPGALGFGSWGAVPPHRHNVRSGGTGCVDPPKPPPDGDGDGYPDASDVCVSLPGTHFSGCPAEVGEPRQDLLGDVDRDRQGGYCRRVGSANNESSLVACTRTTSTGFGATRVSSLTDWGYEFGREWTDFNGDGRADYCRVVGAVNNSGSHVACTPATDTGFNATVLSPVIDWGYQTGRDWTDFSGDRKADYCRRVGGTNLVNSHVACTPSTGTGFAQTVVSPVLDWGYETGRAWIDFNGDRRSDFCRVVGGANHSSSRVACTLSTGSGFGRTVTSPVLDWGFATGRAWTDVTGDGRADYCRRVGGTNNVNSFVACTPSTGDGFGPTITSGQLDWGYDAGRDWADFNGDRRADFCRAVGVGNNSNSYIACTLSTGSGFGATVVSPVLDWGYEMGRAWVDHDGDGRADYCRVVGVNNNLSSYAACTRSQGSAFGATTTSSVLDWGYDTGRGWMPATSAPRRGSTPAAAAPNGPSGGGANAGLKLHLRSQRRGRVLASGVRGSVTRARSPRCSISVRKNGRKLGTVRRTPSRAGLARFTVELSRPGRRLVRRPRSGGFKVVARCGADRASKSLKLTGKVRGR